MPRWCRDRRRWMRRAWRAIRTGIENSCRRSVRAISACRRSPDPSHLAKTAGSTSGTDRQVCGAPTVLFRANGAWCAAGKRFAIGLPRLG